MPAYYRAPLGTFVTDTASSIIGALAVANRKARFPLEPEAVEAWELQLPPLVQGCRQLISELPEAARFEILLEYPIPRVGKRIDAVILMHDLIVAIETKTGLSATTAERQVDDYAINLACFHEPSVRRTAVGWDCPSLRQERGRPGHPPARMNVRAFFESPPGGST